MSPATLIADLLEAIIAELGNDREDISQRLSPDADAALKACVLASPALRAPAQRQLFKTISISSRVRAEKLSEILAENPEIARSVLQFSAHSGRLKEAWMYAPSPFSLTSLLSLLPFTERFALSTCDFTKHFTTDGSRESLYRSLPPAVVHFSCGDCTFYDSSQLVTLLRQFQSPLRSLNINIPLWMVVEDARACVLPEIKPQTLTVHALWGSSDVVRPWFSVILPHNLTRLDITLHLLDDVSSWQNVLDNAPKLRSIEVHRLVHHPTSLNLNSLSELRQLSASYGHIWDYQVPANNPDPMRAFCRMLVSVTSSRMEHAKLAFSHQDEKIFKLVDWARFRTDVSRCTWASGRPHFDIVFSRRRGDVDEQFDRCISYLESSFREHDVRGVKVVKEFWEGRR